ncbi:hypothetical protein SAMN03080615_00878 [Amphritea atlantica]|uniref:Uncharacterized protein n=1 Tax=Amphritea atlantica TaxID=355243 RepID=A0A1H9EFX7_9GAMM|nr:hypothetical protein [Amphritea atlantica]SEQ24581.1 hypothetical protein SAMN03080615_00878 [Amphritea atlantica]
MPREVVLKTEIDAFNLLRSINDGSIDADDIKLKFDGWPLAQIHLVGPKYHNSITPSIMKAFIELQRGIHRAYAYAEYGTYNVNKLTVEDKKKLELAIGVEDGSSIFNIDLQEILDKAFGSAVSKMSSKELVLLIIVLGSLYAGNTAYKDYLQDRKDARQKEIIIEEKKAHIETFQFMSAQETERMKLIRDIAKSYPAIDNVQRHAHDTATEVFKRAGMAEKIGVGGAEITGEEAQLLTRNAKRKSAEVRLDGSYRLMEVNSSFINGFKVKVRNVDSGAVFWAKVQDTSLTEPNKAALIDAEWGKVPVKLKINAKDLAGSISQALIVDVESFTEQEKENYLGRFNESEADESSSDSTSEEL